jgi:hypothetical protein
MHAACDIHCTKQAAKQNASSNIVFIIDTYIEIVKRKEPLGGPRCRCEDNIKIDEHSSFLGCSFMLPSEVTGVSTERSLPSGVRKERGLVADPVG